MKTLPDEVRDILTKRIVQIKKRDDIKVVGIAKVERDAVLDVYGAHAPGLTFTVEFAYAGRARIYRVEVPFRLIRPWSAVDSNITLPEALMTYMSDRITGRA